MSLPDPSSLPSAFPSVLTEAAAEEATVRGCLFAQADLAGVDLTGLSVQGCAFVGCRFTGSQLSKWDARDTLFLRCDFSGAHAIDAFFGRCQLEECKAIGLDARHALLREVTLRQCRFDDANFDNASLQRVRLERTGCAHTTFTYCQFRRVTMTQSDFTGAHFTGTPLSGLDFTTCTLANLTVSQGAPELSGAMVTPHQAVGLASLLGLIVKG